MKKFGVIFQFLSKKGVFVLGVILGILFALLSVCVVHAEEAGEEEKTSYILASGTKVEGGSWNIDVQFELIYNDVGNPLEHFCAYRSSGPTQFAHDKEKYVSTYQIISDRSYLILNGYSDGYGYEYRVQSWSDPGLAWTSDTGKQAGFTIPDCLNASIAVYMFETQEDAVAYLKGESDASKALNYEEIQSANKTFEYNADVPYYDDAVLAVNVNNSVRYDAKMTLDQQNKILPDINYATEYEGYAIYISQNEMGLFNDAVLRFGIDYIVNNKKMDELITFDESGRLRVKEMVVNESLLPPDHSGGGGRHSNHFSISSTSPIVALKLDELACPLVTSFQRNLSSKKYLNSDTGETFDNPALGVGYVLVGYYTTSIVRTYEDNSKYGYQSYSYQWIYDSFRKRYGSGTNVVGKSVDGIAAIVNPDLSYNFDDQGNDVNLDALDTGNVLDYMKNGFGLTGRDGYIEMSRRLFLGTPDYIWLIIAFAMAVNVVIILFKALRGM